MRRIAIQLTAEERQSLNAFRSKGWHPARELNRAHILAALDQGVEDEHIARVLGVSRVAIWRTRSAFQDQGLEYALRDVARPGAPRKYQALQQAEVVALACTPAPAGQKRWTVTTLTAAARQRPQLGTVSRETIRRWLKKNVLKPWRKAMWCIGQITTEYRERMYALCDLYARPYDPQEPVVCLDEKSKQLLACSRQELAAKPGKIAKQDYEYRRKGTRNIFMAVEPKGGQRAAAVTARRTKVDFVRFVQELMNTLYAGARKVHLVLDNLNTHFRTSFEEVLGPAAASLLQRLEFHYTPKHASWLNMAELEIGIMEKQCTGRRLDSEKLLTSEVAIWQQRRNEQKRGIDWKFTRQKADEKLGAHYVT